MILAAREGKTEAVVELVKTGANVDMQTEVSCIIYIHVMNHNTSPTMILCQALSMCVVHHIGFLLIAHLCRCSTY